MVAQSAVAEAPSLGIGPKLLPGYERVPAPAPGARGAWVGGNAGYAFTESQALAPGSHHRASGRLGIGVAPTPWLGLALGTHLRHDRHSDDGLGPDSGTAIDSEVEAVAGARVAGDVLLGGGVRAHFARGDDLTGSLTHPTLDFQLLAAYAPIDSPASVGLLAGYRHDRSGGLLARASEYRPGDRLALGVSDLDALLFGLATSWRLGRTELIAELGADLLVGSGAPALHQSPLRASAGVRHSLSDALALRMGADVSLSSRAAEEPETLYPVEPRLRLGVGLTWRVLGGQVPPPPAPPAILRRQPPPPPPAPSSLLVSVTTLDGHPLSDAQVEIVAGGRERAIPHERLGRYRLDGIRPGPLVLRVGAERLETHVREVELVPGEPLSVEVRLAPASASAQIRGLIRSFDGRGLRAQIRIQPLGRQLSTSADGTFLVEVPPGRYDVVVEASGHVPQRRSVEVGDDGVVILNADLPRAR